MTQNSWKISVTKSNDDAMHYYIFQKMTQNRQKSRPGETYPYRDIKVPLWYALIFLNSASEGSLGGLGSLEYFVSLTDVADVPP